MPPRLRAGRSVEGLHQLRVALRRLEVALKAFGEEFQQEWLSDLRGRAKILSSRLGPARDLDVFLTELLDAPAEEGDREAFLSLAGPRGRDARQGLEAGRPIVSPAPISPCWWKMSRRWPIRACPWRRMQGWAGWPDAC